MAFNGTMSLVEVARQLRDNTKPGSIRNLLADELSRMPNDTDRFRLVREEPAPPPVAADTMDVGRYDLRISEAQRLRIVEGLRQSQVLEESCGNSAAAEEISMLRGMLSEDLSELPVLNGLVL